MKITEAQLRQIIKENLSEADPKKRKEAYTSFNWACGRLSKVYNEIGEIIKTLDTMSRELGDDEYQRRRDEFESARQQVIKVYRRLDDVRKELRVEE